MQCRSCGAPLRSGSTFCTNCGAATPYNISGAQPAGPPQYQPIDPSSPAYNSPQAQATPQSGIAPGVYGAPSYGMPQEQAYGTPPPNPYGTPVSPGAYAAPPPPPTPYGGQYAPAPGSFIPPPDQPPRRQGPNVGLIIGIVALVVLLVAGGIIALLATRNNPQTNTIITNPQSASAVDSNNLPTSVTSNFRIGQTVYVTFHLNTNKQAGYVQAKLYSNTTYVGNKILTVQPDYDHGYFSVQLYTAATGKVELYWCTQSNCSDAKLANVVTFTVS
jgi:zinc ribbon protein